MLVLDSDLMSILLRGPVGERSRLMEYLRMAEGEPVAVTIITFEEQMRGWLAVIAKAKTPPRQVAAYARLHAFLADYQQLPVLDFDIATAERFAELRRRFRRHGAADLKIAALLLETGGKLLSRNVRDFRDIPGLDVVDPLAQ